MFLFSTFIVVIKKIVNIIIFLLDGILVEGVLMNLEII